MIKTRTNRSPSSDSPARSRLRITTLGVLMLAFGLLLWARFLLVTSHPRTAYAGDDAAAVTAADPRPHPQTDR